LNVSLLRRYWRNARLLAKRSAAEFYTVMGRDVIYKKYKGNLAGRSLWLNLGYWKEAATYPEACAAMARLLGEEAGLNQDDRVLDVGFGYADQDMFWTRSFGVASIVGINVTPLHVEVARQRVAEQGLQDRIQLHLGSATQLPFPDASFDKVLALECAFHFSTRESFFADAYRMIRPGGRIALADMIPLPGQNWGGISRRLKRRLACIPEQNMYDRERYAEKLEAAGFEKVSVRSIREYVYPGLAKCLRLKQIHNQDINTVVVQLNEEEIRNCTGADMWDELYGVSDYAIATGYKRTSGHCAGGAA
jgi:microcystin synthetase protein McyJ